MTQGSPGRRVLIVESSAKTKTLSGFLGREYKIIACGGHIADLPKDRLGIDVDRKFEPEIVADEGKVNRLKRGLRNAAEVYLASDPDREGEAIAADLLMFCVPDGIPARRITFNSITYHAVTQALTNPRDLDRNLVTAQRARRALDRLIGFVLSRISKHDPDGPACPAVGRVIVPATLLVVMREREVEEFREETFFQLRLTLSKGGKEFVLTSSERWAESNVAEEKKERLLAAGALRIVVLERDDNSQVNPPPPFSTTDLQEAAERFLGFSPAKTMKLAQQLYEGIEIDGKQTALITYMRTDSTRVSPEAMGMARKAVEGHPDLGAGYYRGRPWSAAAGAQDAHEAIRPVHPEREELRPDALRYRMDEGLRKLYGLIYSRFLCSQIRPAVYEKVSIEAEGEGIKAETVLYRLIDAGFLRLYRKIDEEYGFPEAAIPDIREGMEVPIHEAAVESHTTKPPRKYTEGSLIRALKEKGIGRPSTYSPTIEKIKDYNYVRRKGRSLEPTAKGISLCRYLQECYEQVADLSYTSGMEQGLDRIAAGDLGYETFLEKEWRWLEPAYRWAKEEGWLNSDLPSRDQTDFLQRLAEEAGEEVPDQVWLSAKLTGERIARFLREQPLKLRLSQVTGPEDVRGVPCYSLFVYYNKSMPAEETAFLKGRGFRYVPGSAGERPAYRFRRQNIAQVEEMRNLLILRYKARTESWLKDIEIKICD